jgi:hypothetical protein
MMDKEDPGYELHLKRIAKIQDKVVRFREIQRAVTMHQMLIHMKGTTNETGTL